MTFFQHQMISNVLAEHDRPTPLTLGSRDNSRDNCAVGGAAKCCLLCSVPKVGGAVSG